jgi:hypothetical protein
MKKLVALLACTVIATSAFAQGTINFTNLKPTKQILTDAAGAKLEGAWAQLYAGTAADNLKAVGSPVALYEGKKAGYFNGGSVDVGFKGPGFFQVKAWKGANSFEAAKAATSGFERIREELDKGRATRTAVDEGFQHALSAIVDANITTLITALILFGVGTGPVRGFAVTLSIGIVASFFSALFVTRSFFLVYLSGKKASDPISI